MTAAGREPTGGRVPLDLAALRAQLASSPDGGRLQPLGLGRVIDGHGALDQLAAAVAEFPGSRDGVVVLAAATPMSVSGRDLRSALEAALGRRFRLEWVTLGPASTHRPASGPAAPFPAGSQPMNPQSPDQSSHPHQLPHAEQAPHAGRQLHASEQLHADEATVAAAVAAASGAGCVVTIGSGTITDIGKAAARSGIPLITVQTAASVNGYADPFSVLLRRGVKRTTPTRWPDTLVIDPEILSAAPPELNRAGVGDLMAMFTASADWYLASAIGSAPSRPEPAARGRAPGPPTAGADPPYVAEVADISRAHGERLLALAAGLDADPGQLAGLARILTLSGIAMGVAGSTAPASGMEHAVSHLLEMAAAARGHPASFHGTQVGVGSIVAAATWAHVRRRIAAGALSRAASLPDPDKTREHITQAFAPIDPTGAMAAECFADYAAKLRRLASGPGPLAGLQAAWPEHDAVLDRLLIGPGDLARALLSAGLPVRFGDLPEPVSDADARWAVASCMLMRQRLSVADLAVLIGAWADGDVDEVLADAENAAADADADASAAGSAATGSAAAGSAATSADAEPRRAARQP